ncbi:MAG: EAL domain-containing protein [Candidatus Izemoplasmatales bacterium]|jgi:EAL domain-containing protein (putative c-di-GMP-specific phosphodiesterase class I)/GGDEF domain-containing protein|nr:EAL domain-containing protein [Candidatus Izemoplasmatales bacterium]
MGKNPSIIERLLLKIDQLAKWKKILMITIAMPAIYALVFLTGGITYSFSHTMYLVIIFAGMSLGTNWGAIIGAIGGIVLGPLMPLSTPFDANFVGYVWQEPVFWIYRALIFTAAGSAMGLFSTILRKKIIMITDMLSHNYETGIPNIYSLSNFTDKDAREGKAVVIAILINNFENIIERLGNDFYNRLLNKLYNLLIHKLDPQTTIVQAANNKFWITRPFTSFENDINLICEILKHPLSVVGIPIYAEYAIGVDQIEMQSDCKVIDSYRHADIAAKDAQRRNITYMIYDDTLSDKKIGIELLSTFLRALEENQTFLVFQPIIDLKTLKTVAFEALIRWNHPVHGLIMPDRFIPLVEETNLINQLTDWVLKKAIDKEIELQKDGYKIPISINVSANNLSDPDFFTRVQSMIELSQIGHQMIEFEVTESAIIANLEDNQRWMKKMMSDGFTMSLDDFGKGYTSLAYLSQFDVKIIKLDQYFMRHIVASEGVKTIVKSAIDLAHKLGCMVVAEGIEDELVTAICQGFGCDLGQGYYFARPLKEKDLDAWLKRDKEK